MIFLPRTLTVWILLLLTATQLQSQVLVKMASDKDHILVGETVKITIEARLPLGERFNWISWDTIPHFEWIEKGQPKEIDGIDGKKVLQEMTVTGYDTGYWVIPRQHIKVSGKTYYTDTLGIRIDYSSNFNPEEEYRDIKEPEDVRSPEADNLRWYILAAATVLILVLMYIFLRRKPAQKGSKDTVRVSAFDEAMIAITALRKQLVKNEMDVKMYYTQLNDILRNFVARQFHLSTKEKTNDELAIQLRQLNMPPDQYTSLIQALRMADFVKFARYLPPATDNEKTLLVIESSIVSLNKSTQ